MADRKISDLTALTAPAAGDYLPIVDISEVAAASKNKRITIEELFRGVPLGTAAAPSIAIEGDENTGIYSPGADQLAISTAGSGRLFVNASGNVGVGTTTVYGKLSLNAEGAPASSGNINSGLAIHDSTIGRALNLGVSESGAYSWIKSSYVNNADAANPLAFFIGATERLRITSAGQIQSAGLGTAASPVLSFSGDPNTGIYSPGADQLAVATNGTGRLFVASDGKIGVGVASPLFPLDVNGVIYTRGRGSTFGVLFDDWRIYNSTSPGAFVFDNGTEKVRITSAGLVGIGTSTPSQKLTSVGNIKIAGAQAANVANLILTRTDTSWSINNETDLRFYRGTGDTDSPSTASVVFTNTGNVGIGTTSVANLLHLRSDSSSNVDHLYLQNRNGGANSGARIAFSNGTVDYGDNRYAYIGAINTGASESGNNLVFATNANGGAATEKVRITSAGLVGVGTSSPVAFLHASGSGSSSLRLTDTQAYSFGTSGPTLDLTGNDSSGANTLFARLKGNPNNGNPDRGFLDILTRVDGITTSTLQVGTGLTANVLVPNGRVGIGTSAPQAELNVAKTGGASTVYIESDAGNNATTSILRFGGASGRSASIQGFRGASSNVHSLDFYTYNSADAFGMRLTPTGLGIGTTAPNYELQINASDALNAIQLTNTSTGTTASDGFLIYNNGVNATISNEESGYLRFQTAGLERAQIDSSGRLLVGTSSSSAAAKLIVQGNTTDSAAGGLAQLQIGSTTPANGAVLGRLDFSDSAGYQGAWIRTERDGGTWTSGSSHPGRLVFSTTADGAASPTERMRISNGGSILLANTTGSAANTGFIVANDGATFVTRSGDRPFYVNRLVSDGDLVAFAQDNTTEGTISVSGTTVSYNGAHLSRWSQLPSGAERTEILRGSVLSNIDEMCEWGEEDNEQLNRMKVSDVEGDKNVSGVFQAWDDDDDTYTNDFYCAMTGDFIIRIAEGVTVERGDLLMSAGDGTAKPQDDDIIRSKTIAKVTSTNVSCTYDDGSYCVPCVLMAC